MGPHRLVNKSPQFLRNRKHVSCFYRVIQTRVEVWENEKYCGNTSRDEKKENNLLTLIIKM